MLRTRFRLVGYFLTSKLLVLFAIRFFFFFFQWKTAIVGFFSIDNEDYVQVDDSVTRCEVDDWQRRISIYNEADENGTAADVASNQVQFYLANTNNREVAYLFLPIPICVV